MEDTKMEQLQEGTPLANNGKSFFYKDAVGQLWFLGIYSNNFKDREDEIFAWQGHLEYAQWVKETGVKLPVTILHQPKFPLQVHLIQFLGLSSGKITPQQFSDNYMKLYKPFAIAQVESVIPLNGFILVAAKILKDKEDKVKLLSEAGWGMSHGYLALNRDDKVIEQYRSFEYTCLPSVLAANVLTASTINEEISTMDAFKSLSDKDRETLEKLLTGAPEDLAESLATMQTILGSVLESKDVTETTEEEAIDYEDIREKLFSDLGVDQLEKAFNQLIAQLETHNQRLDDLAARVESAELSDDEKIAAKFHTPVWQTPTQETLSDDEKDALKEKAVGDSPLEGVDIDGKNRETDPVAFTWQQFVFGDQS
jgi:hypothetical protein